MTLFALLGFDDCVANLDDLLLRDGFETAEGGLRARKFLYNRWLAMHQGPAACTPGGGPEFVNNPAVEAELLACFMDDVVEDDLLDAITPEVIRRAMRSRDPKHVTNNLDVAERARELLFEISTEWGLLFDVIVNRVFCVNVAGSVGGSTGRAIGSIWINLPSGAAPSDVAEFLVHELTHHLTFLDVLGRGHYQAGGATASATSAIRRTSRPVACVLDSLLVGVEILAFRRLQGWHPRRPAIHPCSEALLEGSLQAAASLRRVNRTGQVFADRGSELLRRATDELRAMEHDIRSTAPCSI